MENTECSTGIEYLDSLLGGKVKALRLKRGLTQSQLAGRVNVTASYISQLERNIVAPSVDSLLMLMEELRVDPGHFLSTDKTVSRRFIQPKSQRQPIALAGVKDDMVKCQSLVDTTEDRKMQPMLVTIEPNTELSSHPFSYKGNEFILILSGEMELDIENETYVLREGDSIYLDSSIPDGWRNTGSKPAQAVWVLSPPNV